MWTSNPRSISRYSVVYHISVQRRFGFYRPRLFPTSQNAGEGRRARAEQQQSPPQQMGKGFEEFQPIFGEAKGEWEGTKVSGQPPHQLLPFLFHVHALDHSQLRIHLTDFHSYTWECVRTVQHLEDLRDIIGVGGSWEEFVDYLIASISSDNVKLILGALNSNSDSGATSAKLVAHKSKGMPLISIPLNRLTGSAAHDAMANLSLELFKAFKNKQNEVVKGCNVFLVDEWDP